MDFRKLGAAAATSQFTPKIVKGRVCQADADVFAYDCADLDTSEASNWEKLKKWIEQVRISSQAEFINLHLTMGLKGGRHEMATVKAYQAGRSDRDPAKQARVWALRERMVGYTTHNTRGVAWYHQEADDGMAQYQIASIREGGVQKSIIFSADKDLWMVEGLHCNVKTYEVTNVRSFGTAVYKDVGNVKPKLIGEGVCWFWHQMIMGDKADDIPGLPMLSGRLAEIYLPLKKPNANRKALACGEAKAVAILKGVRSHKVAYQRVAEAYADHYGATWQAMLFEQAFLLWMRRVDDELDVLKYLEKTCGFVFQLTPDVLERLQTFRDQLDDTTRYPSTGF